jgi:hypothetical protein
MNKIIPAMLALVVFSGAAAMAAPASTKCSKSPAPIKKQIKKASVKKASSKQLVSKK